jgi:DNA topoisomerase-1
MNLIIVESPTKSKTLQNFLGPKYKVLSSYGHIRDLPKSELGVDVENDFRPRYIIPTKSRKIITLLKKESKKAETVILACDQDREGEAIAYHLTKVLKLDYNPPTTSSRSSLRSERAPGEKSYQRIVFHEITKKAIEEALKNPRKIDMDLVNAQQARRILDRLVGYKLSPLLWKKIMKGLSAGRVQSVTVRLVVEREREIENFKPEEYWQIAALLRSRETDAKNDFLALLVKKDDKVIPKLGIKSKEETEKIVKDLKGAEYKVVNIEKKEIKRNPLPPFTTSSLQQQAWSKLYFSAKKTMYLAQNLYERGLISYHRTDSLNLSEQALSEAKKFITEKYGKGYWPGFFRRYKTKSKNAQEAHEAIRPTHPEKTPEELELKTKLDNQQHRLYDLIWRRFIASQMTQAIFDSTIIDILTTNYKLPTLNYTFRATGQILKFDGFLKIYQMKMEENELPPLEKNEIVKLKKLIPSQHFTQPPARYSEASLIKTLEKEGIGRPSTYAPTLDTIQKRNYVKKDEKKRFQPTEIGILVNDILVEHFPKIVDIKFTAEMEENLDKIAAGKEDWIKTLDNFYQPFEKNLKQKYQEISKKDMKEKTDKICPQCGSPLVIRWSRYGKFYGCSKFPKCKYKESLPRPTLGIECPKCSMRKVLARPLASRNANAPIRMKDGEIVEKRTKKGKIFYGCNRWPDCDFALWDKPSGETCPKCGSLLVIDKRGRIKCSNKECQ